MQTITRISELRNQLRQWRQQGQSIAFAPTMGNLHEGHMALVRAARQRGDKVVVSIFVNPTQFGEGEDFEAYPRTELQDAEKLQAQHVDLLFLPAVEEMYPQPGLVSVIVKELSERYCGASRPGHFDGVATVVCKLFNMVQPDMAFFGEKDFQQLAVIRQLVADLNMPVEIVGVPIIRESDGLAMSSRNGYLTPEQRMVAPRLYQALYRLRDEILTGKGNFRALIAETISQLHQAGFEPDYVAVSRAGDLQEAGAEDRELVILAAAKLGGTRLIDNICFTR